MNNDDIWELLVRYGAGRATPAEVERLTQWCAEPPGRAGLPQALERLATISRRVLAADDAEAAWRRLERRLVGPVGLGQARPALPTQSAAGSVRPRWRRFAAAAVVAAMAGSGLGIVYWRETSSAEIREVMNHGQAQMNLNFPDGSRVVLAPKSVVRYAAARFPRTRDVTLQGEGFFTVAHDPAHPFIVRTASLTAEAVGTAFGVRAYQGDSVAQVIVADGQVLLRANRDSAGPGTTLDPYSQGAVDQEGRITAFTPADSGRDSTAKHSLEVIYLNEKLLHAVVAIVDTFARNGILINSRPRMLLLHQKGDTLCVAVEQLHLCMIKHDTTLLTFDNDEPCRHSSEP